MKNAVSLLKASFYFARDGYADVFQPARYPRKELKSLWRNSLYRNAVYLIADSVVTTILKLMFWDVVARLYLVEDVGLNQL
jgi:hypothetical protein